MTNLFDAFISYGRADSLDFATKLYQRLTEQGLKVWFDKKNIPFGVDYQREIDEYGIEKAHNFLFIIGPRSLTSPYCRKEIDLAVKLNKRIIPLLHVKSDEFLNQTHPIIGTINWIWFQEGINNFEESFANLIYVIQKQANYVELHTQILAKALEWERHQKQHSCLLVGEEREQAESWLKIRFKTEQAPCSPTDLHCEFITESIKNANNLMTQVFLSYAEEDELVMKQIRNSLRRESFTVWTNKTDIQMGEAFQEAVYRGIEEADNVVYLLSPESLKSEFCQQELEYALSLNKRIIPILVSETDFDRVPPALQQLHYIDLTDNVKEEDYLLDESQLLKILHQDAAYYNEHKVLLAKALKWQRQHCNPSILLRGYNLRHAEAWLKVAKQRGQHLPTALHEEFIAESLRQPQGVPLDVFVSYSRTDSDFARKLNDALQMQGKTTWFDQESIASGGDFQQEIYRGIECSDNFLFILSPASVNSPYCAGEVEYAVKLNKRFVTVLHRQVNPADLHPELAKVQWIDFNQQEGDFFANFNQLVRTLDTDREHLRNHTKWSQRAIEWEEKGRSEDLLLRGSEFALAENWLKEAEQHEKQPAPTLLQKDYVTASREVIAATRKRQKHQVAILSSALVLMSAAFVAAVGIGVVAVKSQRRATINEIEALSTSSEARFALGQQIEALLISLRATKKLQAANWAANNTELRAKVMKALQQSVYSVNERNSLGEHKGARDVSFSLDGQTIATSGDDNTVQLWRVDGTLIANLGELEASWSSVATKQFSSDSKSIATFDGKTVKLWRLNGTLISTLEDGEDLKLVNFSPDGKTFATSDGKTVKLRQINGTLISTLKGHKQELNQITFSRDGRTIGTSDDETVKFWRVDGTLISTVTLNKGFTVQSFSPNGRTVATSDGKTVKLRQLDGTLISTLKDDTTSKNDEGYVRQVNFSPDGKTVATSKGKTAKLWQLDGTLVATLEGHGQEISAIEFSPTGQTIATASWDKTVKLWQQDGTWIGNLTGHNDWVNAIAFSPDGQTIASTSDDGTIKLWKTNPLLKTIASKSTVFSDDGQTFATTIKDGPVKIWRADGTPISTLFQKSEGSMDLSLSADGKAVVTTMRDSESYGPVQLWKTDGTLIKTLIEKSKGNGFVNASLSKDGQTLVTTMRDSEYYGPVQVWKIDGTLIKTLIEKSKGNGFVSTSLSKDGQTLVTTMSNYREFYGPVQLWKTDGTLIKTLIEETKGKGFVSTSLSKDGQTLVTMMRDSEYYGPVQLWKADGTLIKTLIEKRHGNSSVEASFSEDGQTVATAIEYGPVQLWSIDGTLIKTLIKKNERSGSVIFSPDGQILALKNPRIAKVFDREGNPIGAITHQDNLISEVLFSLDSKMIASSSWDNTVKLWDRDGSLLTTLTGHTSGAVNLNFSPDGKTLASVGGGNNKTVILHSLDGLTGLDALQVRGCQWIADYLKTHSNNEESDRTLCDGIGKK